MGDDTYTGKIKATVLAQNGDVHGEVLLDMGSRAGRYALRCLANNVHGRGLKLLTEPVGQEA